MRKDSRLPILNIALLLSDLVIAISAFLLGLQIAARGAFQWGNIEILLGPLFLSLITISFFPAYRLYNYQSLFSSKIHRENLLKAFTKSAFSLTIIFLYFNSSIFIRNNFNIFITVSLFSAILLLLLSKYSSDQFINFLLVVGVALLFAGFVGLTSRKSLPLLIANPRVVAISFLLTFLLVSINRMLLTHAVFFHLLRKHSRRQVVIIGSNAQANKVAQNIIKSNAPFWVAGSIAVKHQTENAPPPITRKKLLGNISDVQRIVHNITVDDILITDEHIDKPTLIALLDFCSSHGINAWFTPKLLPIISVKLVSDNFCGQPMILFCSQKNSWVFNWGKQCFDFLTASILLVILSPLFLCIILLIKIDSAGPVLYRFQAIGKKGIRYEMFKFRSMRVDSGNKIHKDYVCKFIKGEIGTDEDDDTPLKITDDPRVTKVGKILRKLSLDELPQLLNVLKGEMSLVGPRPCLPYEFEIYQEWYKKRTSVLPGISGLWQITGRSEVAFEDMILLDLYYVYNRNMALDLNILFDTIFVVLEKKGGY